MVVGEPVPIPPRFILLMSSVVVVVVATGVAAAAAAAPGVARGEDKRELSALLLLSSVD